MSTRGQLGGTEREITPHPRLAVVLVLANDEGRLGEVLESVAWVDERLAVDLGSTDGSVRACEAQGVSVIGGRELAGELGRRRVDWVLLLEGHEQVSAGLAQELLRLRLLRGSRGEPVAYGIDRQVRFFGRTLAAYSSPRPRPVRLARCDAVAWPPQLVAIDQLVVEGTIGRLEGGLVAEPYRSLQHYVSRIDVLTAARARVEVQAGRGVRWRDLAVLPFLHSLRFFPRAAVRDGLIGAIFTVLESYGLAIVAAKRWELEQAVVFAVRT